MVENWRTPSPDGDGVSKNGRSLFVVAAWITTTTSATRARSSVRPIPTSQHHHPLLIEKSTYTYNYKFHRKGLDKFSTFCPSKFEFSFTTDSLFRRTKPPRLCLHFDSRTKIDFPANIDHNDCSDGLQFLHAFIFMAMRAASR